MYSKKDKVLTFFKGILQFITIFVVIFIIVSFIVIGPKKSVTRLVEAGQALFGKLDTNVKIDENTIIEEGDKFKPDDEKIKKELSTEGKDAKIMEVKIPYEEQKLPKFNEEKFEKATKMYSESEVKGLSNAWYYNQLDEYGKLIYRKLKSESGYFLNGTHTFDFGYAFNDLLNSENGQEVLESAFQQSVNALMFDFPQLFFVNVRNITIQIQKTTYYANKVVYSVVITNASNKTFYIDELETKEDVNRARNIMESIRYTVMERIQNPTDPHTVTITAHDFIVDTVEYDQSLSRPNIYNMYGALQNKRAVCEGYAKAYKYLLDYYGIPNIIVAGKGINDKGKVERHAWNYVYIDGKWYGVDTTWDDPIIRGNAANVGNKYRYRYFLKGGREFLDFHIPDGELVEKYHFNYPQLSTEDYKIKK